MLLSNVGKYLVITALFALTQACGSSPAVNNSAPAAIPETASEFPFSTIEPDVYQAEAILDAGEIRDKWFVARKGTMWRIDFFDGAELERSLIKTDTVHTIDHRKKVFAVDPQAGKMMTGVKDWFFRTKKYRTFERLGPEGGLTKFRIAGEKGAPDSFVFVDEKAGLVVRQEFGRGDGGAPVVYELRELRFDVDDSVFAIPAGYKRVEKKALRTDDER